MSLKLRLYWFLEQKRKVYFTTIPGANAHVLSFTIGDYVEFDFQETDEKFFYNPYFDRYNTKQIDVEKL